VEIVEAGADILAACREHGRTGQDLPSSVRTEGWPAWTWASLAACLPVFALTWPGSGGWPGGAASRCSTCRCSVTVRSRPGAALAFTAMSVLGPRLAARLGPRSITLGAGLDVLGTIALILTGARYGGHLTGWDLAPATAIIGLGQGIALPSLIGAALAHVPPDRADAGTEAEPAAREYTTEALH
jgi:hypothetical protein